MVCHTQSYGLHANAYSLTSHRYGYVTNSKVKFVMVVDSSNTALRDNEIRSVSAEG